MAVVDDSKPRRQRSKDPEGDLLKLLAQSPKKQHAGAHCKECPMTKTDTDKLVEMAQAVGLPVRQLANGQWHIDGYFGVNILPKLAALRAAIIADLCGDVEPVAFMYPSDLAEFEHREMVAEAVSVSCTSIVTRERTVPLYSASTIAALKATHSAEVEALKARIAELEKDALPTDVAMTGYTIDGPGPFEFIKIERARQMEGPPLWAVRNHMGYVLSTSGEWEWEPLPSSRDDEFLARCRFPTARAAIDAAIAARGKTA